MQAISHAFGAVLWRHALDRSDGVVDRIVPFGNSTVFNLVFFEFGTDKSFGIGEKARAFVLALHSATIFNYATKRYNITNLVTGLFAGFADDVFEGEFAFFATATWQFVVTFIECVSEAYLLFIIY